MFLLLNPPSIRQTFVNDSFVKVFPCQTFALYGIYIANNNVPIED